MERIHLPILPICQFQPIISHFLTHTTISFLLFHPRCDLLNTAIWRSRLHPTAPSDAPYKPLAQPDASFWRTHPIACNDTANGASRPLTSKGASRTASSQHEESHLSQNSHPSFCASPYLSFPLLGIPYGLKASQGDNQMKLQGHAGYGFITITILLARFRRPLSWHASWRGKGQRREGFAPCLWRFSARRHPPPESPWAHKARRRH